MQNLAAATPAAPSTSQQCLRSPALRLLLVVTLLETYKNKNPSKPMKTPQGEAGWMLKL